MFAEALACKKPIVATAVGGAGEMVADGINGYLIPPRADGNMARLIIALLSDRGKIEKLAQAEGFITPNFDIKITVAQLLQLYKELAEKEMIR